MLIKRDTFLLPRPCLNLCPRFSLFFSPGLKAVCRSHAFLCCPWLSLREPGSGRRGMEPSCGTTCSHAFIPQTLAQLVSHLPCPPSASSSRPSGCSSAPCPQNQFHNHR